MVGENRVMLFGVMSVTYEIVSCSAFVSREGIDFSLQRDGVCVIRYYNRINKDDAYSDTFDSLRLSIRAGEVMILGIQLNELLMTECLYFIECVESEGNRSLTGMTDSMW